MLIARDVTVRQMIEAELDKSRQLFASFMENSPAMAFIKNLSGRYVFCNPAFGECLGLPPQKIIGRLDTDIWPRTWPQCCASTMPTFSGKASPS